MLKDVLYLRKGRLLVDKLGSLKVGEQPLQLLFRFVHYSPEEAQGKLFADHRQGLEQLFLLGREAVDASREHTLHSRRDVKISRSRRLARCGVGRPERRASGRPN